MSSVGSHRLAFAAGAAALALGLGYLARRLTTAAGPTSPKSVTVTQLWIYPVKSCGGFEVTTAKLDQFGVEYDREWVIVRRRDSTILSQREIARMKLITAVIDYSQQNLVISLPAPKGRTELRIPLAPHPGSDGPTLQLHKWQLYGGFREEKVDINGNDNIEAALTEFLGEPVFLARAVREEPRNPTLSPYPTMPTDRVLAQDFSSLHIITEEGVEWIRQAANDHSIDANRFRANIIVAGSTFPEEDFWKTLIVTRPNRTAREGESATPVGISIRTCKGCTRCMIPTISADGVPHTLFEPTKTLREQHALHSPLHDTAKEPKPVFGLSCFHDGKGTISVGDILTITSTFPRPH